LQGWVYTDQFYRYSLSVGYNFRAGLTAGNDFRAGLTKDYAYRYGLSAGQDCSADLIVIYVLGLAF
jgi:hypothetical protein